MNRPGWHFRRWMGLLISGAGLAAMREESYSFIWQPKVLMNTFFCTVGIEGVCVNFSLAGFKAELQICKV